MPSPARSRPSPRRCLRCKLGCRQHTGTDAPPAVRQRLSIRSKHVEKSKFLHLHLLHFYGGGAASPSVHTDCHAAAYANLAGGGRRPTVERYAFASHVCHSVWHLIIRRSGASVQVKIWGCPLPTLIALPFFLPSIPFPSLPFPSSPPSPLLDNIRVMVIVWRLRGNIIRTAPCWVV